MNSVRISRGWTFSDARHPSEFDTRNRGILRTLKIALIGDSTGRDYQRLPTNAGGAAPAELLSPGTMVINEA